MTLISKAKPAGIASVGFYRSDALPGTQPIASKHWRRKFLKPELFCTI